MSTLHAASIVWLFGSRENKYYNSILSRQRFNFSWRLISFLGLLKTTTLINWGVSGCHKRAVNEDICSVNEMDCKEVPMSPTTSCVTRALRLIVFHIAHRFLWQKMWPNFYEWGNIRTRVVRILLHSRLDLMHADYSVVNANLLAIFFRFPWKWVKITLDIFVTGGWHFYLVIYSGVIYDHANAKCIPICFILNFCEIFLVLFDDSLPSRSYLFSSEFSLCSFTASAPTFVISYRIRSSFGGQHIAANCTLW